MLQGGENPRFSDVYGLTTNAGYVFSDSHAPGTIPRRDLALAFDFYDHSGDTTSSGFGGFHDLASGAAYLIPGWTDGATTYGTWGKGAVLEPFGAQIQYGYLAKLITATHDTPPTVASGLALQNAPAAMQGNGTFTVVTVFRYDVSGFGQCPIWVTGDTTLSGKSVSLAFPYTGSKLTLNWGGQATSDGWRWFISNYTPTAGNWFFVATVVTANGSSMPLAQMWVGVNGTLVDELAGVSSSVAWGSPTTSTANVTAGPLILGSDAPATNTLNGSYAGLFVYGRALGRAEVSFVYQSLKSNLAKRSITLQ